MMVVVLEVVNVGETAVDEGELVRLVLRKG
jgi:hypothetical protein